MSKSHGLKWIVNRREMLKSLGGAAVLLHPIFRSFHAFAQSNAPKRCIFLFTPNGSVLGAYLGGAGAKMLAYDTSNANLLNAFASDMLVFNGMENATGGPGDAHAKGIGTLLTGKPFTNDTNTGYSTGISIDQFIADRLKGQTPYHSLTLGAALKPIGDYPNRRVMSSRGNNQPIFPNENPQQIFDLLFGNFVPVNSGGSNAAELERIRAQKRSVLDFAATELQNLSAKVSPDEKRKLEEHLQATRDLELRLQGPLQPASDSCYVPERLGGGATWTQAQLDSASNYAAVSKAHIDLIVQAMSCDLVRVASLAFNGGSGLMNFGFLGGSAGSTTHHGFSHASGTDPFGNLTKINRWYAEQVAYLVSALKSKPEGDGTMLDNTVIFWGSDISNEPIREVSGNIRNSHSSESMRFALLGNLKHPTGSGRAFFDTGRQLSGGTHKQVLAEICNGFGFTDHPFGPGDARLVKA